MRITLSDWMTRLWTLQEAFLSRNLYFEFSDRVYSVNRLERLFRKEDEPLQSTLASLYRTYNHQIVEESRNLHGPDSAVEELVTAPNFCCDGVEGCAMEDDNTSLARDTGSCDSFTPRHR